MKKVLITLLMFLPLATQAQGLKKGYHGFADAGYCLYLSQLDPATFEVTTSHGYQFNPYIFLGAGTGFNFTGKAKHGNISGNPYLKRDAKVDIPIFFNARANFTQTKFSPFVDARIGSYVNNDGGIYANVAIGGRYAIGDNIGLSLSIGYEVRKVTIQQLNIGSISKYYSYPSFYYTDRTDESLDGLVFKLGVDF